MTSLHHPRRLEYPCVSCTRKCRIRDEAPHSQLRSGSVVSKLYEAKSLTHIDANGSAPPANDRTVVEHSDRLVHFASLIIVEYRLICDLSTKSTRTSAVFPCIS